ncbi:MAG TPA: amidohydrolase family protein [Terriglobia bacterium]|nr:amidohydrolase family protein [Terriglobia bacterium]
MSDDPHSHSHGHSHTHSEKGGVSRRKLFQAAAAFTPLGLIGSSGADPLLARASDGATLGVVGQPRPDSMIWKSLREHAARMTIFDTHEHLWHEDARLAKKVDFFLLFSHYTNSDLISAGMPAQAVQDLQNPEIPLEKRWKDFAPYWPFTRTTGYGRCMLIAARDLFGVEDINEQTYRTLSERISAANRPGWFETVLKEKARIELSVLDDLTTMRGEPLKPEPKFFKIVTRLDYIVTAKSQNDLDHIEKVTGTAVSNLADLEKALARAIEKGLREGLAGIKTGLAYERTLHFEKVSRPDAERVFEKLFAGSPSQSLSPAERKPLEDYLVHKLIQQAAEHHLPVQIHTGLQAGNTNHIAWTNPSHLSDLLNEYPQVRFDLFHGGYPYGGEFATLAKNLPNVYPDLCWLHIIAPGVAKRALHELIETVPANKILGYGGDFFHVEGAYGHAQMARAVTAEVLAEKVERGYLKDHEAAGLMERILHQNGKELFS